MPTSTSITRASATELARRIRAGETSSATIVAAHIEAVRRTNPQLNAVVADRFDAAMGEARAADAKVQSAKAKGELDALPTFHGVPCTIKECFSFEGMPWTAGLVARKGVKPDADATAVARIRAAGAIPLGVTNTSELCMWLESNNRVYGRTLNPYDPTRIVGGSSGGEGAIVGAGASPFGLGSDVGGSIRMPAFFNGVFGHKASGGMVPGSGQHPPAGGVAQRYVTTGPICRKAADLMPLLRLLAGPDGMDTGCEPYPIGDETTVSLKGMRVLNIPDNGRTRVHPALRRSQARVVAFLERRGAIVETVRVPALKRSFEIWAAMLSEGQDISFAEQLREGRPDMSLTREAMRMAVGRSDFTLPALVLAVAEGITHRLDKSSKRFIAQGLALRAELTERMGDGVMLFPSYSEPAPRHNKPMRTPFDWVYTAILNVMEFPSTQVPLGLDARGLPVGVQVAARHGQDHRTIAVALALEEEFGGWTPPAMAS